MICQPQQVAPGQGFTLSLWFTQTHPRESDIIVVALVRFLCLYVMWLGGCLCFVYVLKEKQTKDHQSHPPNPTLSQTNKTHKPQHADTKQYFGGFTAPISQTRGQVNE